MKKPPGGSIITTHGSKASGMTCTPRKVPLPSTSRGIPISSSAIVKPTPLPTASSTDSPTVLRDANASWRPSTTQFVTMSAMYAPSDLCTSGTMASSDRSATPRNVAMIRM